MAADLLAILIKANLAAAAAILLALALRKPARKTFGARIAYALWLLVPLAVGASFLPAQTVVVPYTAPLASTVEMAIPSAAAGPVTAATTAGPLIDDAFFIALWLVGVLISLSLLAWSQSRFIKSLGGVVREGRFLRARAPAAGPAVVGAIFPRIVLPADFESRYDPVEQQVVLAHETAHLASGDTAVNAVAALAQCLFWFNPLIHLAARALRIDQELACDAAVLIAHPQMRRPYAEALLKTQLAAAPLPLGCYWPAGASNPLKERIAMLKFATPSRARRLCGGAGVLALCFGAGLAAWAAQPVTVTLEATPLIETPTLAKPVVERALSLTDREVALAAADTSQLMPQPTGSTQRSFPISTSEAPLPTVQSDGGNTFHRIDADPAPERLYALRVTMPDGAQRMVTTGQGPLAAIVEAPEAYRAAVKVYAAAKQEEAARMMRGAPPQPLTPTLEAALKTMSDFRLQVSEQQRAAFEARMDPIRVASPGGPRGVRTFTYWVPKDLTAQGKVDGLATLDRMIAGAKPPLRESLIEAREILAEKPTTG